MSTVYTEIVVDPYVPLVRIVREFDAPPGKVFLAHTDPELVAQWNGPNGTEMRIDHGVREGYERLDTVLSEIK
jgi:uncharacterized protein YndB with AHSA1/START domain